MSKLELVTTCQNKASWSIGIKIKVKHE